jgi:hypothetical protein
MKFKSGLRIACCFTFLGAFMRTDKIASLFEVEQPGISEIYPDIQGSVQLRIPASVLTEFDAPNSLTPLQKTESRQVPVDGQSCIKNQVTDAGPDSPSEPGLMIFHFQDRLVQNPAPSLYEIPRNYISSTFTNSAQQNGF